MSIWKLPRTQPALPNSYFWTWDHSTNWQVDDPGVFNYGCYNRYLKQPETYLEDYRRLTDFAADLGVKGILIFGFLRDSHGGISYAQRVADYAASKGVAILPGIGITWYGGPYYEGDHKYNIDTFLKKNPSARAVSDDRVHDPNDPDHYVLLGLDGQPAEAGGFQGVCPSHPLFREWIQEGLAWLFDTFAIGGVNLENGDFFSCACDRCQEHKRSWPAEDAEFFRLQALSYEAPLAAAQDILRRKGDKLITWATYSGFVPGSDHRGTDATPDMHCDRPAIFDRLHNLEVAQWTLTGMLHQPALPLTAYLDEGAPGAAFDHSRWPEGLRPPSQRGVGYLHQGSQWHGDRYIQVVSAIKEGCLRAYRAGLEGVVIQGEVSAMHIPSALNYLAFSHFIHWPEDTLRDFGRKTLGEIFENESEGERFVEILAHWDAKTLNENQRKQANEIFNCLQSVITVGNSTPLTPNLTRLRFWYWLNKVVAGEQDPHTASVF